MLDSWGFTCGCPLCASDKSALSLSDQRRDRLTAIQVELASDGYNPDLDRRKIGTLVDELERLIDSESMWLNLMVYYETAARAYLRVGDVSSAAKYAALAEEWWLHYGGAEHENVRGLKALWRAIRTKSKEAGVM